MAGAAGAAAADLGTTLTGWLDPLVRVGRGVAWYVTELMGDHAYATYADHQRSRHPGQPLLSEREFWRRKMDDQDRNPGARCC